MTSLTSNGAAPRSRFASAAFICEAMLLVAVSVFLAYVYWHSIDRGAGVPGWLLPWQFEWGADGWLFLRVLSLFVIPLWAWRVVLLFRPMPGSRLTSIEFTGEVVLLAAVGSFFVYMYWDSLPPDAGAFGWLPWNLDWSNGAWRLPRMAVLFGTPFWLWRAVSLFRASASGTGGQIMDTGFLETDDDPAVVARRWVLLIGTTGALLVGCWVLGFHIAVPAYTILYLTIFGNVKWYWTVPPALFFEAIILGIYGYLLQAYWGTPLARDWPVIDLVWDAVAIYAWQDLLYPAVVPYTWLIWRYLVPGAAVALFIIGMIYSRYRRREQPGGAG